ncbi:hypothetical protein [Nitrososphaera sp.]|uniref:hypothetical protein n=1 Tax=Nitrososphaera sp. TaxID=1971748 RepID=UPI0017C8036E|nr:hypothetical protein [Nitrososphaera sp.]NWG36063.1 hypothetical protein [Nitrososphaera sp.]
MVIWRPQPDFPRLKCKVCGSVKKQADKNDDITIDKDGNFAAGVWFCPNGHANKI